MRRRTLLSIVGSLTIATLGGIIYIPHKIATDSVNSSNSESESYDSLSNVSYLRKMSDSDFYQHSDGEELNLHVNLYRVLLGENNLDVGIGNLCFCYIGKDDEHVYSSGYYYVYRKDRKKLLSLLDLYKDPYNLPRLNTHILGNLKIRPIPDVNLSSIDVEGIGKIKLHRLKVNPFKNPELPLEVYLPKDDSVQ
jgi:hypothetical protein